jgi:hypothetical protein
MVSTAEAFATWLARTHDQQDADMRDDVVKQFKLFVQDTQNSIRENDSVELEQLLLNSFKLVSKGSTWAKVWRIDLTKTGTKEIV